MKTLLRSRALRFLALTWLLSSILPLPASLHAAALPVYRWTNFAGEPCLIGSAQDGPARALSLGGPTAITRDQKGNLLIGCGDNTLRKITPTGAVSIVVGNPNTYPNSDVNGRGLAARLGTPTGITRGPTGTLFITEGSFNTIRQVSGNVISTYAGLAAVSGTANGNRTNARFSNPTGIISDAHGNLFVADSFNRVIRQISPTGIVSTFAGVMGVSGTTDGPRASANFNVPSGIALGPSGELYVSDLGNHNIRKIAPDGTVSTIAGTTGVSGTSNGHGTSAKFSGIGNIVAAQDATLYVSEQDTNTIRKITPTLDVSTFVGLSGTSGYVDGTTGAARFQRPEGMVLDGQGNLYVCDFANSTVRKITPAGVVTTIAGTPGSWFESDGTVPSGGGAALAGRFQYPFSVARDSGGNLYVADLQNHAIRKVSVDGVLSTFAGQPGVSGTANGTGTGARFNQPAGLAVDSSDNLYVADQLNHLIRKITPGGVVTTVAGTAGVSGTSNGTGTNAKFNRPISVAVDSALNLYVGDSFNQTIRKITSGGTVSTLAGLAGVSGTANGTGSTARFNFPTAVALDSGTNVFVADQQNHTIRRVTSGGAVTTIAGLAGVSGTSDGGGSNARFFQPTGVAVDSSGLIYVADFGNNEIRLITGGTSVHTIGGAPVEGLADGEGSFARIGSVGQITVDASRNIYGAAFADNRILIGRLEDYQPDVKVGLATSGKWVGENIYNLTGAGQIQKGHAPVGGTVKYSVLVQNDLGNSVDHIFVKGDGSSSGFKVSYFVGATDVTADVVAGTYQVYHETFDQSGLICKVKVLPSAHSGQTKSISITATSQTKPTAQDVAILKTIVL